MNLLKGKKTYLAAVGIATAGAAYALGFIDQDTMNAIVVMLGGGGLAALRAGVEKR